VNSGRLSGSGMKPRRGMLGIIGGRLQAVDIPRLAAMRAGPGRSRFSGFPPGNLFNPILDGCRGRRVVLSDSDLVNQ
jgi:hypothetical protein